MRRSTSLLARGPGPRAPGSRRARRWWAGSGALVALVAGLGANPVPRTPMDVRPIEVGQPMPDAKLERVGGESVTLSTIAGGAPLALIFYRGGW